ncbi:hypothetical protein AB4028_16475, partial [Janibacter sp. RAF20_2_2]
MLDPEPGSEQPLLVGSQWQVVRAEELFVRHVAQMACLSHDMERLIARVAVPVMNPVVHNNLGAVHDLRRNRVQSRREVDVLSDESLR